MIQKLFSFVLAITPYAVHHCTNTENIILANRRTKKINIFERHLVDELHEINNNLKSINRSLSLLTSAALFSEEKNEDNKDGRDTESNNTI